MENYAYGGGKGFSVLGKCSWDKVLMENNLLRSPHKIERCSGQPRMSLVGETCLGCGRPRCKSLLHLLLHGADDHAT